MPEGIAGPVAGLAEVLASFSSDRGTLPRIGDDDDAVGIDLSSETDRPARLRSRVRTVSRLLDEPLSRSYPGLDEGTAWLCGALPGATTAGAHARQRRLPRGRLRGSAPARPTAGSCARS